MSQMNGFLLVVVGLLLLYVVITGKLDILENFFEELFGIRATASSPVVPVGSAPDSVFNPANRAKTPSFNPKIPYYDPTTGKMVTP